METTIFPPLCFILTMWYVNKMWFEKGTNVNTCFILTMWYVNEYLKMLSFRKRKSFILTMWYVNFSS